MSSPTPGPDGYGAPGYAAASPYSAAGPSEQMGMGAAVRSVLTQYVTFSGRARRSEYWWFYLAYVIASFAAGIIDAVIRTSVFAIIVGLGLLLPTLAVGVRRLHDIGKSGWWLLIGLIPLVGGIVLLVFACRDSQPGTNQWGPSPKYGA